VKPVVVVLALVVSSPFAVAGERSKARFESEVAAKLPSEPSPLFVATKDAPSAEKSGQPAPHALAPKK
jgi:hypothetical protein